MKINHTSVGVSLAALMLCTGCSVWNNKTTAKKEGWSFNKMFKKEYQKPQSMAAIWSSDVLAVTGQPPTRGFGGRIYFYNERSQAIPIEGDLVIHGYAGDSFRTEETVQADKTFRFTQEQMVSHFSPSELGASYSVWIPWDVADGFRQEVTLIPTFKAADGTVVQGAPAKVNLPGRNPFPSSREAESVPSQAVSYRKSSTPTNPGYKLPGSAETGALGKMKTTTIAVPPSASIGKTPKRETYTLGGPSNQAQGLQQAYQTIEAYQNGTMQQSSVPQNSDQNSIGNPTQTQASQVPVNSTPPSTLQGAPTTGERSLYPLPGVTPPGLPGITYPESGAKDQSPQFKELSPPMPQNLPPLPSGSFANKPLSAPRAPNTGAVSPASFAR